MIERLYLAAVLTVFLTKEQIEAINAGAKAIIVSNVRAIGAYVNYMHSVARAALRVVLGRSAAEAFALSG